MWVTVLPMKRPSLENSILIKASLSRKGFLNGDKTLRNQPLI